MELGLDVPSIFVVPHEPFDRQRGVNVAEFEFPAYYNYFLLQRRIRLVVESIEIEARLRRVMQESLFGPERPDTRDEYPPDFPEDGRPDFTRESDYFRRGRDGIRITVDTLVDFVHFDAKGIARLAEGVSIEIADRGEEYRIHEGGEELVRIASSLDLPDRETTASVAMISEEQFVPPAFGITVLGSSHGFDPRGKTTGFVLWIAGRGILVDPPVQATNYLRMNAVPSKLIDGVILTHCHADHDSGAFQKILEEGRIDFYTTPTILGSFLRKYSALSGISQDLLRRTFVFNPVQLSSPHRIHGAEVRFFYTLHSIPTIGFEVFCGGKSLAFSADALWDPERIRTLQKECVIGKRRADDLIAFPFRDTLVLHEAGIPPLHTPAARLAQLPDDVKENLWLVHIADKDLPAGQGLKTAKTGLQNTFRLDVTPGPHAAAAGVLGVLGSVDLFRDFTMSQGREALEVAREVSYPRGTRIIAEGSVGDTFYVVVGGEVSVVQAGKEVKSYRAGDYFGETALVLRKPRNADVIARTDVDLIEIDRDDFLYLLRGTDIRERLERLAGLRDEPSWDVIKQNSLLRGMSSGQKTQLQSWLEVRPFAAGELLWEAGKQASDTFLVESGFVRLEGTDAALEPFGRGAFLGEIDSIRAGAQHRISARAETAGRAFKLGGENLSRFFQANPGLLVALYGTRFVE